MKLWRISEHVTLDGQGGMYGSARWHAKGRPVVYAASHPALAMIEALVNIGDRSRLPKAACLFSIVVPDEAKCDAVLEADLPEGWRDLDTVTRTIGTEWLDSVTAPLLRIPAAPARRRSTT